MIGEQKKYLILIAILVVLGLTLSLIYPFLITMITSAIFAVFLVIYLLEMFGIWDNFMSFGLVVFLAIFLVFVPLAFNKGAKYDGIVVTPKYLIQKKDKNDFEVVAFDDVVFFNIGSEGIKIKDKKSVIVLGLDMFREEVDPIIDILEAKGKTFDKEKDFMIRPIAIHIVDNKIVIEDLIVESKAEKLYQRFSDEFEVLTPGFINSITIRNTMIDDFVLDGNMIILYLNRFEILRDHPANTKFENTLVRDCVAIFSEVKILKAVLANHNGKEEPKVLPNTIAALKPHLKNGVFSEKSCKDDIVKLKLSAGIHQLTLEFEFEVVLIGWNNEE